MFIKDPILHQGIIIGHQEITHHHRRRRDTAILLRLHLLGPLLIRATSIMISLHHHHRSTSNTNTNTMSTVVDVAHFSRAAWPPFAVAVCWRSAAAFRHAKQMQLSMFPCV